MCGHVFWKARDVDGRRKRHVVKGALVLEAHMSVDLLPFGILRLAMDRGHMYSIRFVFLFLLFRSEEKVLFMF